MFTLEISKILLKISLSLNEFYKGNLFVIITGIFLPTDMFCQLGGEAFYNEDGRFSRELRKQSPSWPGWERSCDPPDEGVVNGALVQWQGPRSAAPTGNSGSEGSSVTGSEPLSEKTLRYSRLWVYLAHFLHWDHRIFKCCRLSFIYLHSCFGLSKILVQAITLCLRSV